MKTLLIQSKNWTDKFDLKWLIENALFVFHHPHHNGNRPHVVISGDWQHYTGTERDCFELDNDATGIRISAETDYRFFRDRISKRIQSRDVKKYLTDYFKNYCGFANPSIMAIVRAYCNGSKFIWV